MPTAAAALGFEAGGEMLAAADTLRVEIVVEVRGCPADEAAEAVAAIREAAAGG